MTLINRLGEKRSRASRLFQIGVSRAHIKKYGSALRDLAFRRSYPHWVARYDTLTQCDREKIQHDMLELPTTPIISVILPVGDVDPHRLLATVYSMQAQLYSRWELCLCTDASVSEELRAMLRKIAQDDSRIRAVLGTHMGTQWITANNVVPMLAGNFIALLDAGDELAEHALYWVAKEIIEHLDVQLIFSDEDKIGNDGSRREPWFKPDWNPALMLSHNAFGRLGVYKRRLVEDVGGFRPCFDGSENYDLVLRCSRVIKPQQIRHIPRILYHRATRQRAAGEDPKPGVDTGHRTITDQLASIGISAEVKPGRTEGYQVIYVIPSPPPRVSVIIATTARPALLGPCLTSLLERTTYDTFEVLLLVNEVDAKRPERANLLKRFAADERVRLLIYPDRPFNYSWVANWGASQACDQILCFLNDDTEVITKDWLEQLVARASLPGVAAVGPMLYYPDNTIQHAGVILGLHGIAGHACHRERRGAHAYFGRACLEQDVSCVTAACLVIRSNVFRELRGFDETLPMAYNDVDLCLRLRQAGWRIIWTPVVELYHQEFASFGKHNSGKRARQFARDVNLMRERWGSILDNDPFYNRNLSLDRPYELAFPPR